MQRSYSWLPTYTRIRTEYVLETMPDGISSFLPKHLDEIRHRFQDMTSVNDRFRVYLDLSTGVTHDSAKYYADYKAEEHAIEDELARSHVNDLLG